MVEQEHRSDTRTRNGLTRRAFLVGTAAAALEAGCAVPNPFDSSQNTQPTPTPRVLEPTQVPEQGGFDRRFFENEKAAQLKRDIENRYNIGVVTRGQLYEQQSGGKLAPGHPDLAPVWRIPTLELLDEYLELLPDHFYHPKEDGRIVRIVLSTLPEAASCYPNGFAGEHDPCDADFNYERFGPENRKRSLQFLTHELIHIATPSTLKDRTRLAAQPGNLQSPWFDKVDSILGEGFNTAREQVYQSIQQKRETLDKSITDPLRYLSPDNAVSDDEQKELFYRRLEYGLGYSGGGRGSKLREQETPIEFLAVLGEYYIHGKDQFFAKYGEFYSQEKLEALYNFVKDDIYKGKEYDSFPIAD